MTDTEHTLPTNFHLIVIPHNLDHWNIPEVIDKIENIETVYLFDKRVHVHCCELTPSYELWPVETRINLKAEHTDNEKLREETDEIARRWADDEIRYVHVHTVDGWMETKSHQWEDLGIGDTPYDFTPYDEQRDATIEHCRCNQAI
jgi:hypothetical protein